MSPAEECVGTISSLCAISVNSVPLWCIEEIIITRRKDTEVHREKVIHFPGLCQLSSFKVRRSAGRTPRPFDHY